MTQEEHFEKTPKKADRWFVAAIVLSLLFGITFSLNSFFNWIFFFAAAYSFFMSYYLLPVKPKIFQQRRSRSYQSGSTTYSSSSQGASLGQRIKKVVFVVAGSVFGLFFLLILIGLFTHDDTEDTTADGSGGEPETVEQYIITGDSFFNDEKYDSAEKYYDKALALDPASGEALYGKGIALYSQQRQTDAETYFRQAYDAGYRNAWLSWALGDLSDRNGNSSEAIAYYKECLSLDSGYTSVYERLAILDPSQADAYRKMGQNKGN